MTNRCRNADGGMEKAEGTAKVVPGSGNAKLEVTFFRPFKCDYWVIGLDPDYRWAVGGAPERDTLWLLAHTPTIQPAGVNRALAMAKQQGYSLEKLMFTRSDGKTSSPWKDATRGSEAINHHANR